MPDAIKKTGSWISLSVIATGMISSITLTIIYFFGASAMQARENKIEIPHVIKSLDHISKEQEIFGNKLDTMIERNLQDRITVSNHTLQMEQCKSRMEKCEDHVKDYHNGNGGH